MALVFLTELQTSDCFRKAEMTMMMMLSSSSSATESIVVLGVEFSPKRQTKKQTELQLRIPTQTPHKRDQHQKVPKVSGNT